MTDDTERRLRESLRAADLPGAPDTLRASMREIASSPAPMPARRWRQASWALPALAAVVVVAVVAGGLSGGFGRFVPAVSSASPSGLVSAAPSGASAGQTPAPATAQPRAGQRVYSAGELEAALAAERASLIGKAVLVDGSIDTSIVSTCHPDPANCPIGRLANTTETVSATPYTDELLNGATGLGDQHVMALIVRQGGLEYLGSMGYGRQGVDFGAPVSQLAGDVSGNPPMTTFIVSGWLGTSGALPCPSVPGSPPPADTPFGSGCPYSWLASTSSARPADSVAVQYAAYDDFVRTAGGSGGPVQGTFLVRLVVDTRQGIDGPRGWQVVARLDAGSTSTAPPSATPPLNAGVHVYTAAELDSILASDRKTLEGKVALVAGTMTRRPIGDSCDVAGAPGGSSRVCLFGALDGTSEDVYATSYTASLTVAPPGEALAGTFALRVLPGGLEFLAGMGHGPGGVDFTASIPDLVQLAVTKPIDAVWSGYIVEGWLVATPPLRCLLESPAPVPDTPFGNCESAWLLPAAEQITTTTGNSMSVVPPQDGIRVQWSAYADYAPNPSTTAVPEPRYGTYLVRLVADTRQGPGGPVGWQVVARLGP